MLTVLQSFSAITNVAMTVNDRWPAVILTTNILSYYLHIQKKKRKKCFLRSYHTVPLLIDFQVFDFNINIQFCYLLHIVFSFFFFFNNEKSGFFINLEKKLRKSVQKLNQVNESNNFSVQSLIKLFKALIFKVRVKFKIRGTFS